VRAYPQRFEPGQQQPICLLDHQGQWLAAAEIPWTTAELHALYRDLWRARALDTRLSTLQRQGRVSFVASAAGHEGAQVGAARALQPGRDWVFPYYRDLALVLALGWPLEQALAQQLATRLDPARGRQMPAHPGSGPLHVFTPASAIASHLPPAVGSGLAQRLAGRGDVTLCSFGEGATSEGDWHAAVNMVGAQRLPVVLLCQNNGYAISVPFAHQTAAPNVASKGAAYGIPGYRVDGMDPLAVWLLLAQVVADARAGAGPSLVEAVVYRFAPHSNADDDSRYRARSEVEAARARDPLRRLRRYLEAQGAWDAAAEQALEAELGAEYERALHRNEAAGRPPLAWMFDDVYAEPTLQLRKQRAALAAIDDLERAAH
jgi:2-oxoisovalerate dehydrogenase E1 component alpha subunit